MGEEAEVPPIEVTSPPKMIRTLSPKAEISGRALPDALNHVRLGTVGQLFRYQFTASACHAGIGQSSEKPPEENEVPFSQ